MFHSVAHVPLQVPKEVMYQYDFDDDGNHCHRKTEYIYPGGPSSADYKCRSMYQAVVGVLDEIIGNITDLLKTNNLWDDTLLVLTSDNGGALVLSNSAANNHPLRGSKNTVWEGGIRVASFVSGGYLPHHRRGQKEYGMIHIADWYTTFTEMIGVDPTDHTAAEHGLPPIDGFNVWPLISGQNSTSPRTQIPITDHVLIDGDYKLMKGISPKYAVWTGPRFPNGSSVNGKIGGTKMDCTNGCLFNVASDWTEHENIADQFPEIVTKMTSDLNDLKKGFYSNEEKGVDSCPSGIGVECACWMAVNRWKGFFGPFQYLDEFDYSLYSLTVVCAFTMFVYRTTADYTLFLVFRRSTMVRSALHSMVQCVDT